MVVCIKDKNVVTTRQQGYRGRYNNKAIETGIILWHFQAIS